MINRVQSFGAPFQRAGLAERAYLILRDRILKAQLPLGASLSRRTLANELGMSLLPVSEALQRLECEGLVESRPRVGTRVCNPSVEDIKERYEVREALESQAARLFAARAGVKERLELIGMAESMDAMFKRSSASDDHDAEFLYAVHSHHSQLHLRIAEGAQCRALLHAIERNQVLIFNWLYDATRRPVFPATFHLELVNAIANGTPDEADKAMRHHVKSGLDNRIRSLG